MDVIVVAFDGMDKELIEKHECENIIQEEFGGIDNDTGITRRMTSELFASFMTGETYEKHGIRGLRYRNRKESFLNSDFFKWAIQNIRGFHTLQDIVDLVLKKKNPQLDRKYFNSDLECETIFDELDAAKPMFVPVSDNPSFEWMCNMPNAGLKYGYDVEEVIQKSREYTERRLEEFWDLSFEFWDFVMLHLHDPDTMQDLGKTDLEEDYNRLDSIAKEIVNEFGDDTTIIFMSDHGMKQEFQHNKNAFYSCNEELFGSKTPHITDFYDELLEQVS